MTAFTDALAVLYPFWKTIRTLAPYSYSLREWIGSAFRVLRKLVRFSWRSKRRAVTITSLPLEVREMIMFNLEWRDVLRARESCKVLYNTSKSLAVWLKLFADLSDSYAIPLIPPKPIRVYSSPDLEDLVLRWYRSEAWWSSPTKTQLPAPRIVRSASKLSNCTLVEGGRWLLTSDDDDKGSVLVHDLDSTSSDLDMAMLIEGADESVVTAMHVCMDWGSPTLAFDLATTYEDVDSTFEPGRVDIWRVVLIESPDLARRQMLSATQITSFQTGTRTAIQFDVSFLDAANARFARSKRLKFTIGELRVVPITVNPSSRPLTMPLLYSYYLVGGYSLQADTLCVYAIPDPTDGLVEDIIESSHTDTPLFVWSFGAESVLRVVVPSVGPSEDAHVLIVTDCGVYTMPLRVGRDELSLTKLVEHPIDLDISAALGPHRAFIRMGRLNPGVELHSFCKFHEDTITTKNYSVDIGCGRGPCPSIDEWTGRVVEYLCDDSIVVFDLVT